MILGVLKLFNYTFLPFNEAIHEFIDTFNLASYIQLILHAKLNN